MLLFAALFLPLSIVHRIADWSSIIGLAVAVAGLVYSVRAFLEAGKAKESAEEARMTVRTLVAADKFQHLGSRAKELHSSITHGDYRVATFLASDLRFEINAATMRWEFLDTTTKARFREASKIALQISEFMRAKGEFEGRDKAKLLKKCDLILAIVSGESGKMQSGLEGGSYEV